MELNLEKGYINVDGYYIDISKLNKVGLIDVEFRNVNITFVYSKYVDYFFMYSDTVAYEALIREIIGNRDDVRQKLLQYQNDYGVEHSLWKQLVQYATKKFGLNLFVYRDFGMENSGLTITSDYFLIDRNKPELYPREVNTIKDAYDLLYSVLPQNLSVTKRNYIKQQFENELKKITGKYGDDLENRETYLEKIDLLNGSTLDKWYALKKELQSLNTKLLGLKQEGIFDAEASKDIQNFLDYSIDYVCVRVNNLNEKTLVQQYGPISDLKVKLRESINRLGFMELLDLYKEYKQNENLLCSKARHAGMQLNEFPYGEYINIYRLGSVLISDKMNQINKNKAKNKYIPQDLLDEALIFYYDTETAKEAFHVRSNEKYAQDKQSGNIGEQKVEYALKWLDKSYIQIKKKSNDKVGNNCILIKNSQFIDEQQEYDHLIVSKKGVFNIETKNYTGKLVVDQYGNWIRRKNNEEEGLRNPLQQIRQHEKVLKSFLPEECRVISVICIANDKAIIEGSEHCPIPIVKSDMLVEFIENWKEFDMEIANLQIEQCVQAIYDHML